MVRRQSARRRRSGAMLRWVMSRKRRPRANIRGAPPAVLKLESLSQAALGVALRRRRVMNTRPASFRLFIAVLCVSWLPGLAAGAQTNKSAIAAYTGPDRESRLLAGAKTEGKVVWYTSLAGSS